MRRRESGKFVPAGQVELMIGVAVLMVVAAIVIPNVLRYRTLEARNADLKRIERAEIRWVAGHRRWLEFTNNEELRAGLGIELHSGCEFSSVAEAATNGTLVVTALCEGEEAKRWPVIQ